MRMSVSRSMPKNTISRRRWTALLALTPLAAQTTTPPSGSPVPPKSPATPEQRMAKASEDIRRTSERLRNIEVPMNVEPAFSFKA